MFGKAIIATLLGAGVTGGAVYVAAHPELLETRGVKTAPEQPEVSDVQDVAAQLDAGNTGDITDETPIEVGLIEPEPADPVLPAAKQLTTRTVIPADKPVAGPGDTAQSAADIERENARSIAAENLDRIITEAGRMASPDLRDQAYLSAVDYALSHSDYIGAEMAMNSLSQPQLRDTARSNIAVNYAKDGQAAKAFQTIDAVEIDDLRDFMRLQVIEAVARGK